MTDMKVHFEKWVYGSTETINAWEREGLIPSKVKFCDDLMLPKSRRYDFTKESEWVSCKRCQKKIDTFLIHDLDFPIQLEG